MNRRNTKIHTDDPVCGLPGSLSERKNRSAPQGKPQTGTPKPRKAGKSWASVSQLPTPTM